MYNWGVDIKRFKKSKEAYNIWRLEQLINFGLNGEKLDANKLKRYWPKLRLDPAKTRYLKFLLWGKKS
jgi:hypothetical protein